MTKSLMFKNTIKRTSRRDNMKKKKETISVDITMEHYGFYHNDEHFGSVHKPYRDWVSYFLPI